MGAENAFEVAADALNGCGGAVVARVGVQAYAEDLPGLERVGQHQQLGLGVGGGTDGGCGEPSVADLAGIRRRQVVTRVAGRPRPALDLEEPRRAQDGVVGNTDGGERYGFASVAHLLGSLNVADNLSTALRDGAPAVERRVERRSGGQSVGVFRAERF